MKQKLKEKLKKKTMISKARRVEIQRKMYYPVYVQDVKSKCWELAMILGFLTQRCTETEHIFRRNSH